MTGKKRYDFIDMAKGVGMLFIMIGHLRITRIEALYPLQAWIYSFHIPLFFFLSGFLFRPDVPLKQFARAKLKSILIPYFCTGIIIIGYELYGAACKSKLTWDFALEELKQLVFQQRKWTIWFLAALLIVNILAYVLKKLLRSDIAVGIAVVLLAAAGLIYYCLGGNKLPWDIDVALPAMPFFFGGTLVRRCLGSIKERIGGRLRLALVGCGALAVSIVTAMINYRTSGVITDMFGMRYGIAPLMYLSAFAGIAAVTAFSALVTIRPLRYLGANSLTYFAFHQTIVLPLTYTALNAAHIVIGADTPWWEMVLYWLMVLAIILIRLTAWNFILAHTKLAFIVGKRKRSVDIVNNL